MRRQIRESTVTLKYVNTIRRNGKAYRYLRAPGAPSVRLPDIDDPRFLEAYTAALKAVPQRAAPGTIAATVEACLRSERAKGLSAPYRAALRRHIKDLHGVKRRGGALGRMATNAPFQRCSLQNQGVRPRFPSMGYACGCKTPPPAIRTISAP